MGASWVPMCGSLAVAFLRLTAASCIAILNGASNIGGEFSMAEQAGGRFENVGRKLDEQFGGCSERLEEDVKRVVTYINEKVVPEVRENSSKALRIAAEQLARLADHLDRARKA
jgi:predicted ArsR family transcriptional regulator